MACRNPCKCHELQIVVVRTNPQVAYPLKRPAAFNPVGHEDFRAASMKLQIYLAAGIASGGVRAFANEARPLYFFPVFLTIPRETRF